MRENYQNLKTQTSFELARLIQANGVFIESTEYREKISAELSWIKRDRIDKDGKLFLLPKEKVKAGLGRSPDHADAAHMRMFFELDRERSNEVSAIDTNDNLLGEAYQYGSSGYGVTDRY